MKKILLVLPLLAMFTSCDWFKLDNQDAWDAQIEGRFIDSATQENVQFAFPNTNTMTVVELGWDKEATQSWNTKPNGTYCNKLVFAGDYKMQTSNSNYYPLTKEFKINKGANTVDFTVVPYARIKDFSLTYDASSKKLVAKFKAEHGDKTKTNSMAAKIFVYTDRFVSDGFNNYNTWSPATPCADDGATVNELTVDVSNPNFNGNYSNRTHYIRVGVVAKGAGVNNNARYNFSPVYAVSKDFSSITEVTDW